MTALAGAPRLVRLALRRDRVVLPAWLLAITALTGGVVASVAGLYATEAERVEAARFLAASPVGRVFDGPASGTSLGALAMGEAFLVLAIMVALMSAQAVVRHTRLEEETGRAELVGSAVVGRRARLAAALTIALGANLLLAALLTGVLVLAGLPAAGSLWSGLALAGIGWVFAGVAAVTAQVLATARGANAAAGAVLGVAFLLRAVGDALGEVAASGVELVSAWPSWASPLGWGQQVRPFHQDNAEVLLLHAVLTLALVVTALALTERRDVGAGLIAVRPGPARAPASLRSALGLAWRLQRGVLAGWALGLALVGASFGAVGESAEEVLGISEQFEQAMLAMAPEGGLVELFFAFSIGFVAIAVAAYTVQALLRMRAEEASGRLEALLATATSRQRWLGGHLLVAAGGTVGLLLTAGATGALTYGAMTGEWSTGARGMLLGALVHTPAALALGGLVVAAIGLVPRWAPAIAWAALGASLVMGQLGALLELPQSVLNLSPFTHVPAYPAQPLEVLPLALLATAAGGLVVLGAAVLRRRDLALTA